jgi:pyruvate-formate lyase-activating enzyme
MDNKCELIKQGFKPGKCMVQGFKKEKGSACEITLKIQKGIPHRLITSVHLSRPEHYLSIYQSGCNMDCLKCHSWSFSQHAEGQWFSPDDILKKTEAYVDSITYHEPVERATSFHALDLCRGCGACVELSIMDAFDNDVTKGRFYLKPTGRKGEMCPNKVESHQIILSPQGFGPARNIIAFTGGDLGCLPGFYAACAEKIKEKNLPVHILFETNGYGLTPQNLDILRSAGIDSFWLDIKAYEPNVHKKLTGVSNEWILKLPEEMIKRGFVLEVLSLYIPGWVEEDQLKSIAGIIAEVDKAIPFTILAFFPEYRMKNVPSPSFEQMVKAYDAVKETGLKYVRLGNLGVFVKKNKELEILLAKDANSI